VSVKLKEIIDKLPLKVVAGRDALDREMSGGYCGDLLSDVMANAEKGAIWLTVQGHQNIVAVALLRELAAIILVNGHQPEQETIAKADEEGICVLTTPLTGYRLAGKLYACGLA
jgi:predicted transcriptional regulator